LFYITGGAPQAVPGTACVVANQTACTEVCCSSGRDNRYTHVYKAYTSHIYRSTIAIVVRGHRECWLGEVGIVL
jgi:hypothetical protein